jgi:1,4-dihydroxy-2-naphthoate octaprenyltransferase
MLPVILFFLVWFSFVQKDEQKYTNYTWTMWMNRISAIALNIFFAWYFLENTQILQAIG